MSVFLLSPAGNFEALSAALANGADAVYFGVGKLNMRSRATVNFTVEDLPRIAEMCHQKNVQAWMTLNITVFDGELEEVRILCQAAKKARIDAVIASDMAVLQIAKEIGLQIHISVQANIGNIEAVRFYAQYANVMVLARELTLSQIASICQKIREENILGPSGKLVQIEVFVHGALCVAVSGKCYMSLAVFNSSANRGDCYQVCRRAYTVKDSVNGNELAIDNHFVMSPSDLCTIEILHRILDCGVKVLKIEGRGRSADYVACVTKVYRESLELWKEGRTPEKEQMEQWKKRLGEVFNRGFWQGGYYLGEKIGEWASCAENKATLTKVLCGKVVNYFAKAKIVQIYLSSGRIRENDRCLITGPTTGAVEGVISSLQVDDKKFASAEKGMYVTFPFAHTVRKNDSFFLLEER